MTPPLSRSGWAVRRLTRSTACQSLLRGGYTRGFSILFPNLPPSNDNQLRHRLIFKRFLENPCEPRLSFGNPRRVVLANYFLGVSKKFGNIPNGHISFLEQNAGKSMAEALRTWPFRPGSA